MVRSPSDVLRLVVGSAFLLLLLLVQWLWGRTLVEFAGELFAGLEAIPTWIVDVVVIVARVLAVVAAVGGIVITVRSGGLRLLGTAGLGAAVAAALVLVLETFDPASGTTTVTVTSSWGPLTTADFPSSVGLGAVAGALTAAAPWLSRRARRIGWALLVNLSILHFLITPASFDTVRAVLCGWVAGAAALVILGGPSRRPTLETVSAGLAAVGSSLERLEQAKVDARGSTPYFGATTDGQVLFVKALGADQRSADLLFRLYRYLSRHELGDERPFSSLRRTVEHEALVALAARDVGIVTPRLVAFATAEPNSFVLAYEAVEGRSLDRVEADELSDGMLGAIWDQVVAMRSHRIAHRDLRLANIFLGTDGRIWLIDFGFSELAASELLLRNDVAELVASSCLKVGPDRAVAAAQAALPAPVLARSVGRLRPWALSGATRTGLKQSPGLLEDLRSRLSGAPQSSASVRTGG